jgi:signal transduction histidine kinase
VTGSLETIAEFKSSEINSWLAEGKRLLDLIHADQERVDAYSALIQGEDAAESDPGAHAEPSQDLVLLVESSAYFESMFFYNLDGVVLASSDESQLGKIVTAQPYYEPSLNEGYVQPPYYQLGTNELAIVMTHQVIDENGQLIGVLAGQVNLDVLTGIMQSRTGLGETGETYLVSLQNNYFLTASRYADEGFIQTRAYHSEGIDRALTGEDGAGTYSDYRGVPAFGVYRWLPGLQAGLLAEIEQTEALAAARQATFTSIAVAVAAALLATVIGFAYALQVSGPVARLTDAARRIAGGALEEQVAIPVRNELGVLGDTFNAMTTRLRDTIKTEQIARREAQEASRAKDLFLATMSHELRTPLNAIIGFLSLMMVSGGLDEDNFYMAERSTANSNRLLSLINNILDLSRISAGSLEITPVPMSVQHLGESLENDLALQFKEKNLEFRVRVDELLPESLIHDEERLYQIAANLVGNALKFTDRGYIALDFIRSGDKLTMTCTDTGIGIPKAKQQMIFDEFSQVDGSSTRSHGGAGLGLSIVKKLAVLMGGAVRVDSAEGQGSTFRVDLPLNLGQPEAVTASPSQAVLQSA